MPYIPIYYGYNVNANHAIDSRFVFEGANARFSIVKSQAYNGLITVEITDTSTDVYLLVDRDNFNNVNGWMRLDVTAFGSDAGDVATWAEGNNTDKIPYSKLTNNSDIIKFTDIDVLQASDSTTIWHPGDIAVLEDPELSITENGIYYYTGTDQEETAAPVTLAGDFTRIDIAPTNITKTDDPIKITLNSSTSSVPLDLVSADATNAGVLTSDDWEQFTQGPIIRAVANLKVYARNIVEHTIANGTRKYYYSVADKDLPATIDDTTFSGDADWIDITGQYASATRDGIVTSAEWDKLTNGAFVPIGETAINVYPNQVASYDGKHYISVATGVKSVNEDEDFTGSDWTELTAGTQGVDVVQLGETPVTVFKGQVVTASAEKWYYRSGDSINYIDGDPDNPGVDENDAFTSGWLRIGDGNEVYPTQSVANTVLASTGTIGEESWRDNTGFATIQLTAVGQTIPSGDIAYISDTAWYKNISTADVESVTVSTEFSTSPLVWQKYGGGAGAIHKLDETGVTIQPQGLVWVSDDESYQHIGMVPIDNVQDGTLDDDAVATLFTDDTVWVQINKNTGVTLPNQDATQGFYLRSNGSSNGEWSRIFHDLNVVADPTVSPNEIVIVDSSEWYLHTGTVDQPVNAEFFAGGAPDGWALINQSFYTTEIPALATDDANIIGPSEILYISSTRWYVNISTASISIPFGYDPDAADEIAKWRRFGDFIDTDTGILDPADEELGAGIIKNWVRRSLGQDDPDNPGTPIEDDYTWADADPTNADLAENATRDYVRRATGNANNVDRFSWVEAEGGIDKYASANTYTLNDVVWDGSSIYVWIDSANDATAANVPGTDTNWMSIGSAGSGGGHPLYSDTETYTYLDVVLFEVDGTFGVYLWVDADNDSIAGTDPSDDTTNWQQLVGGGSGDGIQIQVYSDSVSYPQNDYVVFNNRLYQWTNPVASTAGDDPDDNTTDWVEISAPGNAQLSIVTVAADDIEVPSGAIGYVSSNEWYINNNSTSVTVNEDDIEDESGLFRLGEPPRLQLQQEGNDVGDGAVTVNFVGGDSVVVTAGPNNVDVIELNSIPSTQRDIKEITVSGDRSNTAGFTANTHFRFGVAKTSYTEGNIDGTINIGGTDYAYDYATSGTGPQTTLRTLANAIADVNSDFSYLNDVSLYDNDTFVQATDSETIYITYHGNTGFFLDYLNSAPNWTIRLTETITISVEQTDTFLFINNGLAFANLISGIINNWLDNEATAAEQAIVVGVSVLDGDAYTPTGITDDSSEPIGTVAINFGPDQSQKLGPLFGISRMNINTGHDALTSIPRMTLSSRLTDYVRTTPPLFIDLGSLPYDQIDIRTIDDSWFNEHFRLGGKFDTHFVQIDLGTVDAVTVSDFILDDPYVSNGDGVAYWYDTVVPVSVDINTTITVTGPDVPNPDYDADAVITDPPSLANMVSIPFSASMDFQTEKETDRNFTAIKDWIVAQINGVTFDLPITAASQTTRKLSITQDSPEFYIGDWSFDVDNNDVEDSDPDDRLAGNISIAVETIFDGYDNYVYVNPENDLPFGEDLTTIQVFGVNHKIVGGYTTAKEEGQTGDSIPPPRTVLNFSDNFAVSDDSTEEETDVELATDISVQEIDVNHGGTYDDTTVTYDTLSKVQFTDGTNDTGHLSQSELRLDSSFAEADATDGFPLNRISSMQAGHAFENNASTFSTTNPAFNIIVEAMVNGSNKTLSEIRTETRGTATNSDSRLVF